MNKLYVINWTLRNGYVISTSYFWNYSDLEGKMQKNPEWTFELIENNDCHMIYKAS